MDSSLLLLQLNWLPDGSGLLLNCELAVDKGRITICRLRGTSQLEIRLFFEPSPQMQPTIEAIGATWGDIETKSLTIGIDNLSGTQERSRVALEVMPEITVNDQRFIPFRVNLSSMRQVPNDVSNVCLQFAIFLSENFLNSAFHVRADALLLKGADYLPQWRPALFDNTLSTRPSQSSKLEKSNLTQQSYISTESVREIVQAFVESKELIAFPQDWHVFSVTTSDFDNVPRPPAIFASRKAVVEELLQILNSTTWLALVDALGRGKTQLARAIARRFESHHVCWVSLRNIDVAFRHLQEQLILWAIQLDEKNEFVQSFKTPALADLIEFIAGETEGDGLLVIDDLPELLDVPQFLDALVLLVDHFSNAGLKLVTTGQYDLPATIESDLDIRLVVRGCPEFIEQDVLEMLDNANAPEHMRDGKILSLILGTTDRHPLLVTQSVYWLKNQNWQLREQEFLAFLAGDPTEGVRGDFRQRLSRLEEAPKELAYRLSLLWDKFDRVLALNIASIVPSVNRSGESLDQLTGPWIEYLLDNTYQVSPLIRDAGKENLPVQIQREIHQVTASYYLSDGTIDVTQAHTIALHLWCAENYAAFASFLIQLMSTAETAVQARYIDWAFQMPNHGMKWPDSFSLDLQIMLRAVQARTCALAEKDSSTLNDELEILMANAGPEHRIAVLFACLITGPMSEKLPAFSSLERTLTAVRLVRDRQLASVLPNQAVSLEEAIWFSAIRLETLDQIVRFLEEIQTLTDTERTQMFKAEIAIEASWHLLDKIWWTEAGKPEDERDWDSVIQVLDVAQTTGMMPGATPLLIAQGRARAVISADYLSNREAAIQILRDIKLPDNPDLSFLIHFTMGCILYDAGMYSSALNEFDQAYEKNGENFSYFRFDSRKRAVVCLSKLDEWHDAKKRCIEAIHLSKKNISADVSEQLLVYDRLELVGELVWIHWSNGNKLKACAALYGVVNGLIEHGNLTEPRFREVFNKTAHALGWYMAAAQLGDVPAETLSGGVYKSVEAGMFGIPRERLGSYESPGGFSRSILLSQMEILAQAVGLSGIAWQTYKLAQAFMSETEYYAPISHAYFERAAVAAKHGEPKEALEIGAQAVKTLSALEQLRSSGRVNTIDDLISGPVIDVEGIWASTPSAKRTVAQQLLLYALIGPVVMNLLAEAPDPILAKKELRNWALEMSSYNQAFEDSLRDQVSHFFGVMAEIWGEGNPTNEDLEFLNSVPLFSFIWYLVRSSRASLGLISCLQMQVKALITMTDPGSQGKYMLWDFGKLVHRFWFDVANTRGFALNNPRNFRNELGRISPRLGAKTSVQVLNSAARAVRSRFSSDIETRFEQILQD